VDTGTPKLTFGTNSITVNQPFTAPSYSTTGTGAGAFNFGQGTSQALIANNITDQAPTSVQSAGWIWTRPGTENSAAGLLHFGAASSHISTETISPVVEADLSLANVTTANATSSAHGFLPILTPYSVVGAGATAPSFIVPTANSQCMMSDPSNYATVTPWFQTCPTGSSLFSSFQVGTNAAMTTPGTYFQLTASGGAAIGAVSGAGTSASPYVVNITAPGGNAGVSTFSGDGNFSTNSSSTGGVTLALHTAGADKWWGNNTASTAAPGYQSIGTQDVTPNLYIAGGGTAQAQTATLSPAATSLVAGLEVAWLPAAANTAAAPTLAVNSLPVKSITKCGTTALVANDLLPTVIAIAVYDGTEFQLLNPQGGMCGTSFAQGIVNSPNNIQLTGSFLGQTYESTGPTTSVNYKGYDYTGTSGDTAGVAFFRGGDSTGATGSQTSGSVVFRAGLVTSASGLPGVASMGEGFFKGSGTTTLWSLQSITAAYTANDNPTSQAMPVGVATNTTAPLMVIIEGMAPINSTNATTVGHTVCVSTGTAGYVTDSGGVGACTAGLGVGIVVANSGSAIVGTGATSSTVSLSSILPLVLLRFM
jgi:hypothetical protein